MPTNDNLEELTEQVRKDAEHQRLVEQSKSGHPELQRQARPTVLELLRQARNIRKFLGLPQWPPTEEEK